MVLRRALPALVLLAGWRCTDAEAASLDPLVRDLARGAGGYRSIAPRLSITRGYAPCSEAPPPPDGTVARAACPALPPKLASSRRFRRVVRAAREAAVEPGALHAAALLDLLWGGSGKELDRSIQSLHTAARLSEDPAALLADLSAAYLLRAERMQTPGDLDRALEAAEEARELNSASAAALYNRALALERIGLVEAADSAWADYLAVDGASGWSDEARARLRQRHRADVAPPPEPTPAAAATFARRAPQQANTWGWETVLPAWADAHLAGNSAAADSALRLAEFTGRALVSAGRDATLADAVTVLRAADAAKATRLARAHLTYAEARRLYEATERKKAQPLFAQAEANAGASPTLRLWARLFHGATLAYASDSSAVDVIQTVVAAADSVKYPALAGRVRWIFGNTLARLGTHQDAWSRFVASAALLRRAGEDEHAGFVLFLGAHSLHRMGSEAAARQERHRAMLLLRPYSRSVWRHNVLQSSADRASEAGLSRAALYYHGEDIRVAERTGRPVYAIEARTGRAGLLTQLGRTESALRDVRAAGHFAAILDAEAQEWARHELLQARATHALKTDPAGAARMMDSVVPYHAGQPARLLSAVLLRAQARLASGDLPGTRADLNTAAGVILQRAAGIDAGYLRGALFAQARHIFDQLVMVSVAAADPRAALEQMEHARAVFAPFPQPGAGSLRPPAGQTVVPYALIGDTLLAWVVSGDSIRLVRQMVDGKQLVRTVEHVRSSLELRRGGDPVQQGLGELYDLLIRPLAIPHGGEGRPLRIVADGTLAGVPFAALYDRRRQRYLMEDHAVGLSSTIEAIRGGAVARPDSGRALLVANPAFDRREHAGLDPLPHATAEVAAIAALYPRPLRLGEGEADRTRVAAALAGAGVVHFAGHAVLDDVRPERSFLLLAGLGGRLTAEEIGEMDLRGTRLVVLSACQTARGAGERAGGLGGLSAALIEAGAEGVVGSLWRVDDALTRELMLEFHRAYRNSADAAQALRTAQLRLLRSSQPGLRSPAAWAGFVHLQR